MENKRINKNTNKKKMILGTVLGMVLFLSTVVLFSFTKKMNVDGLDYIAEAQTALHTLTESASSYNTDSVVYYYLTNKTAESGENITMTSGEYQIRNNYDWLALMVISYYNDLDGVTFTIQPNASDYALLASELTIGETTASFKGISRNEANPFKGNLVSSYTGKAISLNLSTPLFYYLDASASINNHSEEKDFVLHLNNASAGLSQVLVGTGTIDATDSLNNFRNIYLEGTISNPMGYAGGIFAEIRGIDSSEDAQKLTINALDITSTVTSVNGKCAGLIAGKVSGNVQMNVDTSMWNTAATVSYVTDGVAIGEGFNDAVGSLFGEICGSADVKPVLSVVNDVTLSNLLTAKETADGAYRGGVYTGGFAGKAANCTINLSGSVTIQGADGGVLDISSKDCNTTYSGGFVGSLVNVTLTGADTATITANVQGDAYYIGGFTGWLRSCHVDLANINVSMTVHTGSFVGGVIGHSDHSDMSVNTLVINKIAVSGSSAVAGGVIGKDIDSTYTMPSVTYTAGAVNITSGAGRCWLGGFGGRLSSTVLNLTGGVSITDAIIMATATAASEEDVIYLGGIIGLYINTTEAERTLGNFNVDTLTIYSKAENYESYVGGIIGAVHHTDTDSETPLTGTGKVTLSNCSAVSLWTYPDIDAKNHTDASITTAIRAKEGAYKMNMGGILGGNFAKNTMIQTVESQITNQWKNVYRYGGVLALAEADCVIDTATDMINTTYSGSNANFMRVNGGIVGEIKDHIFVEISNVVFDKNNTNNRLAHRWDCYLSAGGIVGKTGIGSVLCLGGTLDLSNLKPASQNDTAHYFGSIVGEQNNSLIYMNPTGYDGSKYTYGYSIYEHGFADEIGNYGSVYRNGNWDGTPAVDCTDIDTWVIQKNNEGKVIIKPDPDDNPKRLNTVGDAIRLAIALHSEDTFTAFDTTTYSWSTLLDTDFSLEADLDLTNTGLQTLNKNKIETTTISNNQNQSPEKILAKYFFTGSITGTNEDNVFTISNTFSVVNQGYLGLFSAIGDGASFENMGITSTVSYYYNIAGDKHLTGNNVNTTCFSNYMNNIHHFGGVAAYALGNITLDHVALNVSLNETRLLQFNSLHNQDRYFGGAIGQYIAGSGTTLVINETTANANMAISEINHYAGGLVGYVDHTAAGGTVAITDTTVGGAFNTIYRSSGPATEDDENVDDPAKMGGVIASIGADSLSLESSVDKKLDVVLTNLTINGVQMQDELASNRGNALDIGGLIGYKWKNVDVQATGITVNSSNAVQSGIVVDNHTYGATYGGLWNTVAGHMELSDVALNSMTINVPGSAGAYSNGLLIGNGQYLYLELENYTIAQGNAIDVTDTGALYLDEIVGYTKGTEEDTTDDYGGVVSIIKEDEYYLYNNQVLEQENPNTRYYYNLAADLGNNLAELDDDETIVISNVAQMLQWSLGHYVNKPLRQFFHIANGYSWYGETVQFSGTIDLGDASYYPVSSGGGTYTGTEDSKIIFNGAKFDNRVHSWRSIEGNEANRLLYTYDPTSEHYMLQSGLFNLVTISTIDNITLSGTVTAVYNYGNIYSGGLVCGGIYGVMEGEQTEGSAYINYVKTPTTITNITLDNLSVSHVRNGNFNGETDDGWHKGFYGLMISAISQGAMVQIGLDGTESNSTTADGTAGVEMINYNAVTDKVAAALIGQVGYNQAQGMNVSFYNMKIADVADHVESAATVGRDTIESTASTMDLNGAKVLAHASFIYSFDYALDNTTNIYIFYQKEYTDQNVTLGSEIGTTVQFYDEELILPISDQTNSTNDPEGNLLDFVASHYKPYVYTNVKQIDVNPKNGNITEGCGTYDDPYIIDKASQLMTLYYYLKDHDQYANALKNWEINALGTDVITGNTAVPNNCNHEKKYYNIDELMDADDQACDAASTYDSLKAGGFPSVEQLNNAYYLITKDIDLSEEDDFAGFGSDELPFTGVFIGQYEDENGTVTDKQPEILMSKTNTAGTAEYGFVKYAKGVVLRNLHFSYGTERVYIANLGVGGGAIGIVAGGDNVIDHIKVSGTIEALSLDKEASSGSFAEVGGYVGRLQQGSVILRNYVAADLSEFKIRQWGDPEVKTAGQYQNGIVGRIGNGYIVDDDATPTSQTNISSVYNANPARRIINNTSAESTLNGTDTLNYADENQSLNESAITDAIVVLDDTDTIAVTQDGNGYAYELNTAQDILAVALAINSGSMNYAGDNHLDNRYTNSGVISLVDAKAATLYGYDIYSRCRIEDYSYVGKVSTSDSASMTAYLNAVKYDNRNPYTNDGTEEYILNGIDYGNTFYRPFIYNYIRYGSGVELFRSGDERSYETMSFVNACSLNDGKLKYRSTYHLAAGNYDLSEVRFKKCFCGIGASTNYEDANNMMYYSFQGNFIGAGSSATKTSANTMTQIKIDLDIVNHPNAGFFTMLYKGNDDSYNPSSIKGFNLSGSVENTSNEGYIAAGGISTIVQGSYLFEDVAVGSFWSAENTETGSMKCISLDGNTDGLTEFNSASAFLVRADNDVDGGETPSKQNNLISFTNCKIINTTIDSLDECGGFLAVNMYNTAGNTFTGCTVTDSTMKTLRGGIGGFVGVTNYNISFENCNLNSSSIVRYNNRSDANDDSKDEGVAGYVGHLGLDCELAQFTDCHIKNETDGKYMEVFATPYNSKYRNKHCGGFVGFAEDYGTKSVDENKETIVNDTGVIKIDNSSINGLTMKQDTVSHVGGAIGLTQKLLYIGTEDADSKLDITDITISRCFFNGTGGVIGQFSVLDDINVSEINNTTVTGFQIEQGWETSNGGCNTGGILGCHTMGQLEITNSKLCGTAEHPTKLIFKIGAMDYTYQKKDSNGNLLYDEEGNPDLAEVSTSLYLGGIVGKSANGNARDYCTLAMENCSVEGAEGTTDYVKLLNGRYVGGLLGAYENRNGISIENCAVKNATIQAIYTNEGVISSPIYYSAAGGFVGHTKMNSLESKGSMIITSPVIENVVMKNYDPALSKSYTYTESELTQMESRLAKTTGTYNMAFGGLIGAADNSIQISDFDIDGLSIGSDGYVGEAGGVVGMAVSSKNNSAKVTITASDPNTTKNKITNSQIVAGIAGGVIGNTQRQNSGAKASVLQMSDVEVEGTTVLAKFIPGSSWELYAGGVTGRNQYVERTVTAPASPDFNEYKNISVKNSVVSGYRSTVSHLTKTYLGGYMGGQLACGTRSYNVELDNVLVGMLAINDTDIPTYTTVSSGTKKLYTTKASYVSSIAFAQSELVPGATGDYADKAYVLNMGTFIGRITGTADSYILKAASSYSTDGSDLSCFHPASDIGLDPTEITALMSDSTKTMDDVYKNYMDTFHILYKETVTDSFVTNQTLIHTKLNNGAADYPSEYPFAQLDELLNTKYTDHKVDNNCDYRLDYNHKQNNLAGTVNYDVADVLDVAYKSESGYLSPYEFNDAKIPMLVSAGKYDINTILNTAINVLTNNGGATNSTYNKVSGAESGKLLSVLIERIQMEIADGNCTMTRIDDNKTVLSYSEETGEFSISETDFDSVDEKTFNLVTVLYEHTDGCVYTLQIPVFVRETLRITTHMKGVEGSNYQIDRIPTTQTEPGKTDVNVELNSSFTLYSEFIYSSAREEYDDVTVEKVLYHMNMNQNKEIVPFKPGTQITLLDITGNNMVYFYSVEEEIEKIPFTAFTSMEGTPYTTKDIRTETGYNTVNSYLDICRQGEDAHTNVGLEKFLIVIDESQVESAGSTMYDYYVRADEELNADLFKNAICTEPCYVHVNTIPGLVKFLSGTDAYQQYSSKIKTGEGGYMSEEDVTIASEPEPQISREGQLSLKGTAYLMSATNFDSSAPDYWTSFKTGESAGDANTQNGKYIEFAISLTNTVTGKRVTIPNGTSVNISLGGESYGSVLTNNSEYIYCYFDTQNDKTTQLYKNINGYGKDCSVDFDVFFNFATATDFSDITDARYSVTVELLDTANPTYPRNGTKCDTWIGGSIVGINKRNLGFALETDELLPLGMNGYNRESSDKGRIAFTSRLDFTDYMDANGDGLQQLKNSYEGMYFTYTFVLERKKTDKSYEVLPGYTDKYNSLVKILDEEVMAGQNPPVQIQELEDIPTADEDSGTEKIVILQKTKQYAINTDKTLESEETDDEISVVNPIMEEEFVLFADVEGLLAPDEEAMYKNVTNHKVTCYVTISDIAPSDVIDITGMTKEQKEANIKAEDFFIFTVAKLKTDMD